MAVDLTKINGACLTAFGQSLTFTPSASGVPQTITGILDTGFQPEDHAPGDSSVYARLWIDSTVTPQPLAGDELSTATTVYKFVGDCLIDEADGMWFELRKDRDID